VKEKGQHHEGWNGEETGDRVGEHRGENRTNSMGGMWTTAPKRKIEEIGEDDNGRVGRERRR
jgi:hypothetical protein